MAEALSSVTCGDAQLGASRVTRIYALRCPKDGGVRYVGKTIFSIEKRLSQHIAKSINEKSREYNTHRSRWIRSLIADGLRPIAEHVEDAFEDWVGRETYWIEWYRNVGAALTNLTDGGQGASGRKATAEQRDRCKKSAAIRWSSDEERKKASGKTVAHFSRPGVREEWADRSRNMSEGTRKLISDAAREIASTDAGRARMSAMATAQWSDPIAREVLLEARQKQFTEEMKGKISSSVRALWADEENRNRFIESLSKRPPIAREVRDKAAQANRGRILSDEQRVRLSAACILREARKRAKREAAAEVVSKGSGNV
jgi:hypothetical protein